MLLTAVAGYNEAYTKSESKLYFLYTYGVTIFCLPFFFFFMFLNNIHSGAWLGSLICAIMYLAFVVDALNLVVMFAVGITAALAAFFGISNEPLDVNAFAESIPVIFFALTVGVAAKYAEERTISYNRDRALALAHSIAHEMRTPLFGLRLELDAMRRTYRQAHDEEDEAFPFVETEQIIRRLERHTRKASNIVELLLANARDEEIENTNFGHYDISEIVSDVVTNYPMNDVERSRIDLDIRARFRFWGSDLLMANVLSNLVANALRATSANGGRILLETTIRDGWKIVRIRDGGIGIAPHDVKRVFDRFYSGRGGGAGLGLAFCKRVVRSFGGTISCTSEPGRYTEFEIRLPQQESVS